jgi:DNA-binding transcriptional regulator YiaG
MTTSPPWLLCPARSLTVDELLEFRLALGLTQASLARALGVAPRLVEDWEDGRKPAPTYLQLALERLGTLKTLADTGRKLSRSRAMDRLPRC